MPQLSNFVSIHPYFQPHAGQMEAFRALMTRFVERTAGEPLNLFYEFSCDGRLVHCREGYLGAEGALAHLENVGDLVGEALKISDLVRLEMHGPAGELAKLKAPLAHLNASWFALEAGVQK